MFFMVYFVVATALAIGVRIGRGIFRVWPYVEAVLSLGQEHW